MMALAAEDLAPEIVPFSFQLVPFADLAETLAHETTYASDLAEVVHGAILGAVTEEPAALPTVESKAEAEPAAVETGVENCARGGRQRWRRPQSKLLLLPLSI